jgi:hypothetical protein
VERRALLKLCDLAGIVAVGIQASSHAHRLGELLENLNGSLPVNAGVGDTDTLLEAGWTLLWNLLVALVDVGLDHDTNNGTLAGADLVTNDLGDLWLVAVVLVGVTWVNVRNSSRSTWCDHLTVRAVDHDGLLLSLLLQSLLGGLDALGIEVGTLGTATENDEAMLVSAGAGDGGQTLLGNTHEVVLGGSSANSVNGDGQASIGTVLETNWERETGSQLTVKLGLGGSGANGTEGDEVGKELWGDGVEHLGGNWHAAAGEVTEELSADAETLVDLEGLIEVWVVDQTLPADGGTWLLEVGAHDDDEVAGESLGELSQLLAVLDGGLWVMEGAWTADDEKTVGSAHDDLNGILATLDDDLLCSFGDGDFGEKQLRWDQRILTKDWHELAGAHL